MGFFFLEEDPVINAYIQTDRDTRMNAAEKRKAGKGWGLLEAEVTVRKWGGQGRPQ